MLIASLILLAIATYASYGVARETDFYYKCGLLFFVVLITASVLYIGTGIKYILDILNENHVHSYILATLSSVGIIALLVLFIYLAVKGADVANEVDIFRRIHQ